MTSEYESQCFNSSHRCCVSLIKEPYKRDYILQKRPVIWRSPLIVATHQTQRVWCPDAIHIYTHVWIYTYICTHVWIYMYIGTPISCLPYLQGSPIEHTQIVRSTQMCVDRSLVVGYLIKSKIFIQRQALYDLIQRQALSLWEETYEFKGA